MATRARFISSCLLLALVWLAPFSAAQRVCLLQIDTDYGPCLNAADPVGACRAALDAEPRDFRARAGLCEAYVADGDYPSALAALEAGKQVHRGDGFLLGVIDRAMSNVREKSETSGKRPPDLQTLIDYMVLRCVKLKNAAACDEALQADPGNREALAGKADLMMSSDNPIAAIEAYRSSLAVQDDADVRARLAQAESRRAELVQSCLNASGASAVDVCESALLAGADDEADLYAKMGDLEASRGALTRALAAYGEARRVRPSRSVSARIDAVTAARRCVSSSSADACIAAHRALPESAAFASVRADVSLAGCRTLLGAARADAVAQATPLCDEARRRVATQAVEDEIDALLAAAAQPAPAEPPAALAETRPQPEPPRAAPPSAPRVSECLTLAAGSDVANGAIAACERELADAAGGADEAKLAAALAKLERRRDIARFTDLSARCLDPDRGTASACERAIDIAARGADTAALQQRLTALRAAEAERPRRERLARLRTDCMQFSLGTLDEAESACAEALDLTPDDDELTSTLARVRNLIGVNRNSPLLFTVGVEAITY